jgi:hypothetical protein
MRVATEAAAAIVAEVLGDTAIYLERTPWGAFLLADDLESPAARSEAGLRQQCQDWLTIRRARAEHGVQRPGENTWDIGGGLVITAGSSIEGSGLRVRRASDWGAIELWDVERALAGHPAVRASRAATETMWLCQQEQGGVRDVDAFIRRWDRTFPREA